jgi:hypothetical protein
MNAFEMVTVAVTFLSLAVCFTGYFRPGRVAGDLGQQGSMWFDHPGDRELGERPLEDAVDAPIPHRPLRGRY